ncbi:MAG: carboxypeptidase-like regulatory domain-containing protein [Parabacteroides gordonii]|uniref:STN domain-containing protein n=1 Tax=Parabacteroides gordonii TaxID=574930 RepID=UPI003A8A1562
MRCILLFILLGTLQITASVTHSQSFKFSLHVENKALYEVLSMIEHKSAFYFTYNPKQIEADRKISVDIQDKNVNELLDKLFKNENIQYIINDKHIVLYKIDNKDLPASMQDGRTITGIVTDANGDPVIGANIVEKETTNGTITDIDGKYILKNFTGNKILISYIGYISQEVLVNNRSNINVKLFEDSQSLDEIIVVGYGTQKKSNVTGAVASIKTETFRDVGLGAAGVIQGRVAGVDVSNGKVIIRGASSINGSDPLWIIDGVEGDAHNFQTLKSPPEPPPPIFPISSSSSLITAFLIVLWIAP